MMLTTAQASEKFGWPRQRFHDVAHAVPEFVGLAKGRSAGPRNQNLWCEQKLEITAALMERFDIGLIPAARIACGASWRGGNLVIDLNRTPNQMRSDFGMGPLPQ